MATIDIYRQYFSAACTFNGVERRAADVWLTAESGGGMIRYEAGVSFFPHRDAEDFAISYDACALKELFHAEGRRSKKRDEAHLAQLRPAAEELAASLGGKLLREARYG